MSYSKFYLGVAFAICASFSFMACEDFISSSKSDVQETVLNCQIQKNPFVVRNVKDSLLTETTVTYKDSVVTTETVITAPTEEQAESLCKKAKDNNKSEAITVSCSGKTITTTYKKPGNRGDFEVTKNTITMACKVTEDDVENIKQQITK